MDDPVDSYCESRARLSQLTDGEVTRVAGGRMARDADPGLLVALREELARRGLRVRPADATEVEPAPPTDDAVIDRAARNGSVRAWRF